MQSESDRARIGIRSELDRNQIGKRSGLPWYSPLQGVAGGKLRYDAIAMFLARKISLSVFCPGTLPEIRQFFLLKSGNYGEKFPILPLLGNLEIRMNRIFHNWEALPYLDSGAYRIISQLPSCYPQYLQFLWCKVV